MYKHLKKKEGSLKKILFSLAILALLTGCVNSVALLGPASTAAGGGNIARSTLTSAIDFGIKRSTGKSSFEHAMAFSDKHNPAKKEDAMAFSDKQNPPKKKVKCVNFLEATESEVCAILNKRASELREKIALKSKIKILD